MTFAELFEQFAARFMPVDQSEAARLRFQALARAMDLEREALAALDENTDHLVFVGSGATKLVAHASAGRDQIVAFHFPEELVLVPARAEHSYSLNTLQGAELLLFNYAEFADLARTDPSVLRVLLESTRKSLARSREKSLALGRKRAPERLAGFLVGMAVRLGSWHGDTIDIDLPMSRRDIADSLGLTIETVSRQFTILRELKVIETKGKSGVKIRNLRTLEANAGYLAFAASPYLESFHKLRWINADLTTGT